MQLDPSRALTCCFLLLTFAGTGSVSLQTFVRRVMPPDYTRKLWNVQRDEESDRIVDAKHVTLDSVFVDKMPASLNKVRWNIDKIEDHIQRKIVERTKRASDQYREGESGCEWSPLVHHACGCQRSFAC